VRTHHHDNAETPPRKHRAGALWVTPLHLPLPVSIHQDPHQDASDRHQDGVVVHTLQTCTHTHTHVCHSGGGAGRAGGVLHSTPPSRCVYVCMFMSVCVCVYMCVCVCTWQPQVDHPVKQVLLGRHSVQHLVQQLERKKNKLKEEEKRRQDIDIYMSVVTSCFQQR